MSWVKDLWRATLPHWWALMSCAVSNIVGVYALALHKDNPWLIRSSFILAGVFVVIAIALAWKDENRKLSAEIDRNSKPNLEMGAVRAVRLIHKSGKIRAPSLLINTSVVNIVDAPSTIRSISLVIAHVQKDPISKAISFACQKVVIQTDKRVYPPGHEGEAWLRQENEEPIGDMFTLVNKQPLERGKHVEGWLLFEALPWELLATPKLSFSLSAKDAFGLEHNTPPFTLALEKGVW
jgi:hypothetical protein